MAVHIDCTVIGGGLTGLSVAYYLQAFGVRVHVVEARPNLGGRATNYRIDGYACGQTFEPIFGRRPNSKVIDYAEYSPLAAGLVIRGDDGPRHIGAEPLPTLGEDTLQLATWMSGGRLPDLPWNVMAQQIVAAGPACPPGDTTMSQFRAAAVDPALASIVGSLDQTVSFNTVADLALDWLSEKALPRAGAGRPYVTLRSNLTLMVPPRTNTTATAIERAAAHDVMVHTTDGDIRTNAVVVAAGHLNTLRLAGRHPQAMIRETIWLRATAAPTDSCALHLGWADGGRVLNTAVVSNVSGGYADQDHLMQATVLGAAPIDAGTLYADLSEIYGTDATEWAIIDRFEEPVPATLDPVGSPTDAPEIVYVPYPCSPRGRRGRRAAGSPTSSPWNSASDG